MMRYGKGIHIYLCEGYIIVAVGLEESMVGGEAEYMHFLTSIGVVAEDIPRN